MYNNDNDNDDWVPATQSKKYSKVCSLKTASRKALELGIPSSRLQGLENLEEVTWGDTPQVKKEKWEAFRQAFCEIVEAWEEENFVPSPTLIHEEWFERLPEAESFGKAFQLDVDGLEGWSPLKKITINKKKKCKMIALFQYEEVEEYLLEIYAEWERA